MKYLVDAPIVSGSGAIIVHDQLAEEIPNYRVRRLSPKLGLCPPLTHFMKNDAADIIHTLPDLGPYIKPTHSKYVVTFHNYYLDSFMLQHSSWSQRAFYKTMLKLAIISALKHADKVVTVSQFVASILKHDLSYHGDIDVVYNGIDTSLFTPRLEDRNGEKIRILFAGNPIRRKGADLLKRIAEELPDNCELYYTGSMRSSNEHSTSGKLVAIPAVPHIEMCKIYQNADILFFPTRREGFGLVIAEAMACGLPIVSTNCSAIPELVDKNKGGFLAESNNIEEMLNYIRVLVEQPNLRAEMGAYNREKVMTHFQKEKMVNHYHQIFNSLVW